MTASPQRPLRIAATIAAVVAACAAGGCGELAQEPQLRQVTAPLALAVGLPGAPKAGSVFGADVDAVRISVYRRNESTALDTTIAWAAADPGLRLAFDIPLLQKVETVYVYVDLMAGQAVRFYANSEVVLRAEVVPSIPPLPLTYIGPGYDAVFLTIGPRTSALLPNSTLQMTATAQNASQAIVTPPIAWSVSDARLATVSASGLVTAKTVLGSFWVRAATPTGLADSMQVLVATQLP